MIIIYILSHAMNLWALLQLWCGACACLWHRIGCCDRSTSISETLCESRIKSVVQLWCPIQFRPKQAHTVIDATRCCDMPACVAMPCICDMPTCMRYWRQMSSRSDVVKCKMPTCVIDWRHMHYISTSLVGCIREVRASEKTHSSHSCTVRGQLPHPVQQTVRKATTTTGK